MKIWFGMGVDRFWGFLKYKIVRDILLDLMSGIGVFWMTISTQQTIQLFIHDVNGDLINNILQLPELQPQMRRLLTINLIIRVKSIVIFHEFVKILVLWNKITFRI